jgi:Tol biopolymer transport system component
VNVWTSTRTRLVALAAAAVCLTAPDASAQYFGRNKVQYKDLDFQILKTEHFDIYFYPSAKESVDIAARMSERWHARLQKVLGHELRGRQPLVLYASHPDFEQTNAISGEIGEGTGGVTESIRRRIILPMGGPLADTDHVIGHELVHAFQFDITTRPDAAPGETGAHRLPLWFIEGMAEYLSIGPVDAHTAMWMRDAAREETLPEIRELDNPKYFPYRWGQAFWSYVAGRWGDEVVGVMLSTAGNAGDYEVAIQRILGVDSKQLSAQWHQSIRDTYRSILNAARPPSEVGRVVLQGGGGIGGDLNVGPAFSPDGKLIAFLSERTGFSIDLFIADAETGKVLRKLTSTATDPHFSSLQFIYSAGGWDATSQRIAIATVTNGRAALAIFNARSGDKEREYPLAQLDEIFNPTWAPDSNAIAFTGMSRGLTDLWVLDLASGQTRQLTNDPFADLQPAWSPDGRHIAFATDRFSSRLDVLDIGPYRLALIDPAGGQPQAVGAFTRGKNINPQWTADSGSLIFISDRDGVSNLYRVTLDGQVQQLTDIATGISGIAASSPALSVASRAGAAAFSVYDAGKYHVNVIEASAIKPVEIREVELGAGGVPSGTVLPPLAERTDSEFVAMLADANFGLPAAQEYEVSEYKGGLQLEAIGQPEIAVGADRFGAAIGGGIGFFFSDMLGNQNLATVFQMSTLGGNFSWKNLAGQVSYMNKTNRWNWGLVGGQVPYMTGGVRARTQNIGGVPAYVEETIIFRQTDRSAAGVVAYPFNRARRVEFQGGVSQIAFDEVTYTEAYDLRNGGLIFRDTQEVEVAESLTMGTASAALVFDTSIFGATSPVGGQRYRLEVAPTTGDLRYTSFLADYRRYFMPAQFYTLATRVIHYGRYGSGGEDSRLYPLYIGYPSLVRGYDVNTIDASECGPVLNVCPAFDRLVGSRILVGNLEFRFPLLRPFGAEPGMYGPLPVEVALFADAGVAWSQATTPEFFGGQAGHVSSVGAAFRVNFLGFAVGEFSFAHPLQRERDWVFQFHLSPGF